MHVSCNPRMAIRSLSELLTRIQLLPCRIILGLCSVMLLVVDWSTRDGTRSGARRRWIKKIGIERQAAASLRGRILIVTHGENVAAPIATFSWQNGSFTISPG